MMLTRDFIKKLVQWQTISKLLEIPELQRDDIAQMTGVSISDVETIIEENKDMAIHLINSHRLSIESIAEITGFSISTVADWSRICANREALIKHKYGVVVEMTPEMTDVQRKQLVDKLPKDWEQLEDVLLAGLVQMSKKQEKI